MTNETYFVSAARKNRAKSIRDLLSINIKFLHIFFFVASVFQYSCCGCVPEPFIYYRNKNARQDKSCCCCCMSFHIFLSFHHFCAISAVTSLANSLILLYFCCCCCCSFIFLCSYTIRRRPTQRMCSE